MKSFSQRMQHLGTENAFSVIAKAKKFEREELEPQGKKLVMLQIGEPAFDAPEHVKEAMIEAVRNNETHYTPSPGIMPLREAVAAETSKFSCEKYEAEDVVIMPGAKPVMFHMLNALIDAGDEVIIPNPGFPIYESMVNYLGGKPVPLPLLEERDFNFSLEDLANLITDKTKLIIINSPQNPTGGVLTRETLEGMAELAKKHDLWVLSDEIYNKIIYEGEHVSITSFEGMPERTVILNGASKAYAMTGVRLGWAVTKNAKMAEYLEQLIINDVSCTATVVQHAGIAALKGPQEPVEQMREVYRARRDLLVSLVNEIPGMSCRTPGGAFYLFVNVQPILKKHGWTASEFADKVMREAHVLILPGTAFGAHGEGYIRFSYVASEDNIREGLRRLKEYVKTI
ncbi:aspartate aminotransferase [Candidatus Peregrinibacteria bacterium CG11_big_fil_rev_8_21_14_0_20_46_8]|nr:MAG: aspartate aminotransferase [Candidatus Peregrinibacteria bacterium CG11_big_fil_rev_8_21_14_0_20_46_8]